MAKRLWELFYTFAKVGVMTFGGGYAMLPILQREVVENKGWATEEELADWFAIGGGMATLPFLYDMADKTGWFTRAQLADMIAVSESTPGPIGVNMATYVGFLTGGVPGAVTATVGLIAPSVIVILIVAAFLQAFRDSKYVAGAFYGLRPASTALITAAGLVVLRETFWLTGGVLFWQGIILAAVLLVLTRWVRQTKNWHPIVFIGLSALVGVVFRFAGA